MLGQRSVKMGVSQIGERLLGERAKEAGLFGSPLKSDSVQNQLSCS